MTKPEQEISLAQARIAISPRPAPAGHGFPLTTLALVIGGILLVPGNAVAAHATWGEVCGTTVIADTTVRDSSVQSGCSIIVGDGVKLSIKDSTLSMSASDQDIDIEGNGTASLVIQNSSLSVKSDGDIELDFEDGNIDLQDNPVSFHAPEGDIAIWTYGGNISIKNSAFDADVNNNNIAIDIHSEDGHILIKDSDFVAENSASVSSDEALRIDSNQGNVTVNGSTFDVDEHMVVSTGREDDDSDVAVGDGTVVFEGNMLVIASEFKIETGWGNAVVKMNYGDVYDEFEIDAGGDVALEKNDIDEADDLELEVGGHLKAEQNDFDDAIVDGEADKCSQNKNTNPSDICGPLLLP